VPRTKVFVLGSSTVSYLDSQDFGEKSWQFGDMASAEREPIMGVWGRSPQAEPLVRGSAGFRPLKLKAFYCLHFKIHRKFASFSALWV